MESTLILEIILFGVTIKSTILFFNNEPTPEF